MQHRNTIFVGILLTASNASGLSIERHEFTWSDINTRDVVEWKGDTAVVRRGTSMQEISCKIKLDSQDIDRAIEKFGIPKEWTTITYSDDQDLAKKQQALLSKASQHGIKMMDGGSKFVIDYAWVIEESMRDLRDVAKTIRSAARRKGYRSRRSLVGAFASFVQALPYKIPPDNRINDDGEEILTVGAMMPIETLSRQWGDCDSKSLLFASLVRSIDLVNVSFIVMDEHLFAAVQLSPTRDDHSIRHKRDDWILVELTDAWPLGRVPEKHLRNINHNTFTVVDLH